MKVLRVLAIVVAFGAAAIACDRVVILTPPPDGGHDGGFVPDAALFPDGGSLADAPQDAS
ncbi:MAG: hypothetical protein ABI678_21620 [Kofleriaceae bacterium]